ncbi:extracellular calcium-sensing receptor-like [Aquarana catesbeiana]|uniref:extracellular calcium-sensing receptor-like n=1 Tax=Aquarana catesbeiana TaxID=8400 RepID=UPI003CC9CEFF
MVYAIWEINNSPNILPNITLGFDLYDSCYNQVRSLMETTRILSGKKTVALNFNCHTKSIPSAIVGDMPSKASIPIARILGLYRYPQISYASAHPSLSDKIQFPSFLRTIPNDNYEVLEIANLVNYFNWTWVGIITTDNELGRSGSQLLTKEIEHNGGCVAFLEILPIYNSIESVNRIIDVIKKSKATVIVVYSTMENLIPLMEEASFQNVTDKVWLGCGSWSITSDFPRPDILTTLNGSLGVAPSSGKIPGFKEFLYSIHPTKYPDDIFIKTFWEKAFGCAWAPYYPFNNTFSNTSADGRHWCTGEERLDSIDPNIYDVFNFRYTYKTHNAVFAIAHALHEMQSCVPERGPFVNGSCASIFSHKPWQLLHYVKKVHFKNTAGEQVFFDKNGDIPISIDILNWWLYPNGSNQYVYVGKYDERAPEGSKLQIDENKIMWNGHKQPPISVCSYPCPKGFRRANRQGQKICCFDCIPCSEGEILNPNDATECLKCPEDQWPNTSKEKCVPKSIQFLAYDEILGSSLASISIIFCLLTFSVFCLFLVKHKTPIVKANNRELSYLLLVSLMFCFLCSLVFIGRPSMVTCMLRQVVFGVIFSICLSIILAKTITVIMVFRATNPADTKIRKLVRRRIPVYIIPFCSLIQILICLIWLTSSAPFEEFNKMVEIGTIVIECNEGSKVLFSCVLGYMGLLASISLIVAFLARNLPDTFNETKFITFSMLVFASVWITFIPAYLSTKGKYMVTVEIFAIISSSAGMLVCIFFPKCYIILLQPEMNDKRNIIGSKKR